MKPIFTEDDIISQYTRAEAISDGVLVDITANFPQEAKLFKYHVAITQAIWALVEGSAKDNKNNQATVIWDILYMSIHLKVKILSEAEHLFSVIIGNKTHTLKAICGPNDDFSPCITIMQEYED